ncbi:MAG: peptidylprolyl isomerase [Chromatiaceae bacterium]|nr:peptidylprolyl isomerase [Gammaproteobacteria bacterium]MCP5448201.1 peptidylprolyl isomerase [Chromatiaceae bacterium]MCB1862146.1 peptidylprolyl isomerase [Gammaproteobacteria bacterium]MCB1873954.1 peptidylprolyl isomerase [Gammaproteobacteria bacterium]MCB1878550.1 peptidylprolyl isomerase [Gammaproteobacteria bacterium]
MRQAKHGDNVKIHYDGSLDDGTRFDSSMGRDPLAFTLGSGQVIPGFDSAVAGMAVGERKSVRIPSEQAYGEHSDELVQHLPKSALPEGLEVTVGMPLQASGPEGEVVSMMVIGVAEDSIQVDANHPLAGRALNFDIELVALDTAE